MEYTAFKAAKQARHIPCGLTPDALAPVLKDFQAHLVGWAVQLGRAAIFAERGLGKTLMQLEWARQVKDYADGRVLIVCPLAVAHQTIAEARHFLGIEVDYVRDADEVAQSPADIVITNYDRLLDGRFDPGAFVGVVLDESSKLKTFTSKTKQTLISTFSATPYRLCCTATPSPNDVTELGNHAEFLGVMESGEMLTRWFHRDSNHANELRLKPHSAAEFWAWCASWAACVTKPSDLDPAYDDTGYDLPPLRIHHEVVTVDHTRAWELTDKRGQASLLLDAKLSGTSIWAEKRETLQGRVQRAAELVAADADARWIIWHDTDAERDALAKAIDGLTIVTGSQAPEVKERLLQAFTDGDARYMATKPRIGGWGLNWQHCHKMIFLGLTHKWEEWYQALGRCHRFGQRTAVDAHLIYAESEGSVVETLMQKQRAHEEQQRAMVAAMRSAQQGRLQMSLDDEVTVTRGALWTLYHGDCVLAMDRLAPDSVHLSLSSWPFSDQYMYSASLADFGNCDDDEGFFAQLGYLLPKLYTATMPGRWAVVHAKDRIVYGTKNGGYWKINRFSDRCCDAMEAAGFLFQGRITVVTDPVRENAQTNRLGHGELQKDASRIGVGMPEYLLVFRKPHRQTAKGGSWSDERVTSCTPEQGYRLPRWQIDANSFWRSDGNRHLLPWELDGYNYRAHVAHLERMDERRELGRANGEKIPVDHPAVWWDIDRTNVLNSRLAKEHDEERHICPLQIDLIERVIQRASNPGDTVLDYFAGIGSVPVTAVDTGRVGVGMELKASYARLAQRYLEAAEAQRQRPTLFDLADYERAA